MEDMGNYGYTLFRTIPQKQTFPTLGAGKMLKNGCSQHWEQPFFSRCLGPTAYFMP